jgi:stage II sporulation protein M
VGLLGGVFGLVQVLGLSPVPLFVAGVLPHGIFEVPALMLASAAVLRIGVALVTPQTSESMGGVLVRLVADWTKVFVGLVLPLLAVAAVVETYVTPGILMAVLNR